MSVSDVPEYEKAVDKLKDKIEQGERGEIKEDNKQHPAEVSDKRNLGTNDDYVHYKYDDDYNPDVVGENTMTKEIYSAMTDKEKAEWAGVTAEDFKGSIKRFQDKMNELGIVYDSIPEMTDEFIKLYNAVTEGREINYFAMDKRRETR